MRRFHSDTVFPYPRYRIVWLSPSDDVDDIGADATDVSEVVEEGPLMLLAAGAWAGLARNRWFLELLGGLDQSCAPDDVAASREANNMTCIAPYDLPDDDGLDVLTAVAEAWRLTHCP